MLYFLIPKQILHSINSLYNSQSKRLVTMSVSLCTPTESPFLTFQVLNTSVCFIDNWCTSVTSVHNNLEYGLAIVTESFSPVNLDYTTSFVQVSTRSDMTDYAIPNHVYLPCTLSWFQLVWSSHRQLSRWWWCKVNADVMHQTPALESYIVTDIF